MNNENWIPFENLFSIPIRNGLTKPSKIRGEGYKMVNMGEIFRYSRIGNVPMERVPLDESEIKTSMLEEGDLLFARQSLVLEGAGKCSIVINIEEPTTYEGHIIRVRLNKQMANPFFYYYFFQSQYGRHIIEGIVEQVAAAGIRGSDLAKLKVPCPSLEKQNFVVSILMPFDDKIDLNHRMSQSLEAMAQAVFRSWFVDFDPVHAKIERGEPNLPNDCGALFPDSFATSPIGEIPKGWDIKPLDEIATFLNGLACQKFPANEQEDYYNVIKIADLRRGFTASSDRASKNVPQEYVIKDGDVLFSWSGSLEVCIWMGGEGLLNQHLFKVSSKKFPKWFYYFWTLYYLPEFRAIASGKATTMGHIQRYHLSNSLTVLPTPEVIKMADRFLSPMIDKIIKNGCEIRSLTQMRDLLLPKLMNGELRIKGD